MPKKPLYFLYQNTFLQDNLYHSLHAVQSGLPSLFSQGYCLISCEDWDMNWLQKISIQERGFSFTLVGNELMWHRGYHQSLFDYHFGLPPFLGNTLRFYFPRGASDDSTGGHMVGASEELRPYAREIADQLDMNPMQINFNDSHYKVIYNPQRLIDNLGGTLRNDAKVRDFLMKYLPDVYEQIRNLFSEINQDESG